MRSPRKVYAEEIRRLGDASTRYVDMTARVRVYRRDRGGKAAPAELLPDVYGGVWDRWSSTYTELGEPVELKVHPGQVRLLEAFDQAARRRTMALGSQGGGKTEGIVCVAVLMALWHPGKIGGVVAPNRGRVETVWDKFVKSIPPEWVAREQPKPGGGTITLANGSILQFYGAKRQGRKGGSSFAGKDWWWAVEDEQQDMDQHTLEEVDARGRINENFQVFSSATNEPYGEFQRRVKEYEANPAYGVCRFTGPENAFTPLKFWEDLKANWDPESYRRKILCEDVPTEGRVYGAFSMSENVKQRPASPQVGRSSDITAEVTNSKYQEQYDYVVGTDFGLRTTCSVILKAFRSPGSWASIDRQWWVIDEIIAEQKTTDWHAAQLLEWFKGDASKFVAITGQDSNSTDPDRSNFVLFKRKNINIVRAAYGRKLAVAHRYSMINALLHAADGKRRLFVDCDGSGRARAKKTVDSFLELRLNASDRAETYGKGTKGGEDMTHYTDAVGYALFPFESLRGTPPTTDANDDDGSRATRRNGR